MDVTGQVAAVTGGAGGIGRAIARRLVENGCRVVVSDLDTGRIAEVVDELESIAPGRIAGHVGDCADEADLARLLADAERRFGPVELFVANAGIGPGAGLDAPDAEWTAALEVNVLAHVRAARLLLPGWLERGRGHFVVTASAAGLLTQIGSPTYSVTKHAAVGFAEWLSVTYGDRGIGVSCLCPMGVDTAMLRGEPSAGGSGSDTGTGAGSGTGADAGALSQALRAVTGAGRVLDPLDVADALLDGLRDERFLVLPHPEVLEFYRRKGADYDRWLAGMRRYQQSLA
ncbi:MULTISPECIES: SDR family oxidoreductase [Pseudonocardia]|uniref:1-deoxy-11-beta-hydroxypentalenate dehydrogenase n=2 Tax=Pseudonocardia TaxID=1847 RepID=A0A1Y2N0K7_PSEAH|nr:MULTISPECIES: SDR family oxidoreductase [Pseudonocardia]OSY40821.1 1-deoxy-11-beta-hydroxypentalenate dehydrogenase [Pseudonocardia autotrophica]TDN71871.1 NADP-dependent 3-hydroxy acid dehydrogenase YdfG [Pseudonocardia autotrophica]BBG02559.1 putative short chain dehydrogenase/reductase [Pseudonocardia autotrophica]GEC24618.1 putative short chain dehydrogenase/reductase [Pseudonocardia saturnea]